MPKTPGNLRGSQPPRSVGRSLPQAIPLVDRHHQLYADVVAALLGYPLLYSAGRKFGGVDQVEEGGSWNYVMMGLAARPLPDEGYASMVDLAAEGFDWDEGLSPVYWPWAAMSRVMLAPAHPLMADALRLDLWLMSMAMDRHGICWHAGHRASRGAWDNPRGSGATEFSRWAFFGKRPKAPKKPARPYDPDNEASRKLWERWQHRVNEVAWYRYAQRPTELLPPVHRSGIGFHNAEQLMPGERHWLLADRGDGNDGGGFLALANRWSWKGKLSLYRYEDGTLASRIWRYSGGGNTGPLLAIVKRLGEDIASGLWPWGGDRSPRDHEIRAQRIVEQGSGTDPRVARIDLGDGKADELDMPPETPALQIDLDTNTRGWVDGKEVR